MFGTVMGIEAVVAAAHLESPREAPWVIRDVRVAAPYILHDESQAHAVTVLIRRCAADTDFHCTLCSRSPNGNDIVHLKATLSSRGHERAPPRRGAPAEAPQRPSVEGRQVYETFFHGPSFQVIDTAQWQDTSMLCRLNANLPPSHRAGSDSNAAPRLIELGLQTSGLLELALSGRMMIPHTIERIERLVELDVDCAQPMFAMATSHPPAGMDIDVLDGQGDAVMIIRGYRTVPLPFAADDAGTRHPDSGAATYGLTAFHCWRAFRGRPKGSIRDRTSSRSHR